jgi:multimeric flavodoxin WrbA
VIAIDADGNITEADWAALDAADAIIFGSPTYMGMASWQFKKFADATIQALVHQRLERQGRRRLHHLGQPQRRQAVNHCSTSSPWPCNKPWCGWVSLR